MQHKTTIWQALSPATRNELLKLKAQLESEQEKSRK